jgi:hypothetical protein
MTTRNDVEGTLARWFAVDANLNIAVFSGAYAAWPSSVFEDYDLVTAADELLAAASPVTTPIPSPRFVAMSKRLLAPIDFQTEDLGPGAALREAACGVFSFDACLGYGGKTVYYLEASPAEPLLLHQAESVLSRAASLVQFKTIRFDRVSQIDLVQLVPFVVGRG